MGKGTCITSMDAVRSYNTKTIMEKKDRVGRGVKDMEFSGVLEKWQVDFPGG